MSESSTATVAGAHRAAPSRGFAAASRWATARRGVPIIAVVCMAAAALLAIVALQGRTRSALRAEAALGRFEVALHGAQDIPWQLAARPRPAYPQVDRKLTATAQNLNQLLETVEAEVSSRDLRGIDKELSTNIAANARIAQLIASGHIASTNTVNREGTAADDAIDRAVEAARADYGNRASTSVTQGTVGASVLIAGLVFAFLVLYRLSIKARADRSRRAEAERANLAKTEFLSRVSHELRTPLNSILGFAQVVARSDLNDRQRGNIDRVRRAGLHLVDLINEVLDISRIESGELRLSLEAVSVGRVVDDVIDLVSPLADAHGVTVTADASCCDAWVRADLQRIKQVLLNLVSNAIKYNARGGRVVVSACHAASGRISVSVVDNGPGIAPEQIDRIFSPFERLGAETTNVEGTGLGLTLSKGFVEAMGGSIAVHSEVGLGSTFVVELEAAPAAPAPRRSPDVSAPATSDGEPKHKVLYIEDNIANLELVEEIFMDRPDLSLVSAVQGTLGILLAREHHPDVVLLDLNLPDISGEEVLARLSSDPTTAPIPVIVVSADATVGQMEKMLARGATACVAKPIDVDEMLEAIDDIVRAKAGAAA